MVDAVIEGLKERISVAIKVNQSVGIQVPENRHQDLLQALFSFMNTDKNEVFPSFFSNGDLYFASDRGGEYDIYVSRYVDGHYLQAEKLGGGINTEHDEWDQAIAPDGSYMIFCSIGRSDSYGGSDLYISFRGTDGSWTGAKNMGKKMNTSRGVCCPSISPDGQYLFFESSKGDDGDIYWVDARIIEYLKSDHLK